MDIGDLKLKYTNTLKYVHELEGQVRVLKQEIEKLQYLTRFMIMSQNKREEMIAHLFEENRRLKELADKTEREGAQSNCRRENKLIKMIPTSRCPIRKRSNDSSQKSSVERPSNTSKIMKFQELSTANYGINPAILESSNKSRRSIRKGYRYSEDLSSAFHQHILNMGLSPKAEKILYNDNEFVTALGPILAEQDVFIDYVSNNDINKLITLFDNMNGLFNEHRSLYNLIYRLKKIIKAANVMQSTLILSESIEKIVDETIEFLECDRATVFILDEKKEELWSKVAKGSDFTIKIPMNKGIVGHVVTCGKSVNILDAYGDERFNKDVDVKSNYRTKTILCSPIVDVNYRVTGAIQAINKVSGAFSKDDEGLLEILANIAGVILRNSLHYDEQLLFQNNLRHILKTGILMNSIFSLDKLIPHAEKVLRNTMNVDQAKIFLLNHQEDLLVHFTENDREFFEAKAGIVGHVVQSSQIESIPNAYSHPLFNGKIDIETTLPIIVMPIFQPEGKEMIGIFEVMNPKGLQSSLMKQKTKINGVEFEILEFFRLQLAQNIMNILVWDKMKGVNMLKRKSM